ncbi:hypothetical protein [uncultured Propionibacterium sp.]|uniref:hypothetical protein n=1 Tax=uncultured Propionibacterium sp. TaxID=218066 RepID=UPI00292EF4C5|nr:hypothetical protein [uncultured Propionibacterium sp.]
MSLAYVELTRHSLLTKRRGTLVWAVALFLLGLMTVAAWSSLKDTDALTGFSEGLPPRARLVPRHG